MNNEITLTTNNGQLVGADYSISITGGDTLTFASIGGNAILCFASQTAGILSPSPAGPVTLSDGQSASYTLGNTSAGTYPIVVVSSPDDIPGVIDFDPAGAPLLAISVQGSRGLGDDTGTGT